jgi:hypothetical protein
MLRVIWRYSAIRMQPMPEIKPTPTHRLEPSTFELGKLLA